MKSVNKFYRRLFFKMRIVNADCLEWLATSNEHWDTIFADPPDNIGLKYAKYKDNLDVDEYHNLLDRWLQCFLDHADTVWFSYNAKWGFNVGWIIREMRKTREFEAKPCVQTFTFGQHSQYDLGNGHRPLLRLRKWDAPRFPDEIRVPSWRQLNGDSRADPRGRVPLDVFDFPRVTGNHKQRRSWHPTQLSEDLVERCLKLTTPSYGRVLDPFAGTGTTARVCAKTDFECTLIEIDPYYCAKIADEHGFSVIVPE